MDFMEHLLVRKAEAMQRRVDHMIRFNQSEYDGKETCKSRINATSGEELHPSCLEFINIPSSVTL